MTDNLEINPPRLRFQWSEQSQAITKLLNEAGVGVTITYQQIIAAAGGDPNAGIEPVRGFLQTARRHLEREKQVQFGVITGVGIQKLADRQILGAAKSKMEHVRRSTRRAAIISTCIDMEKLVPTERTEMLCLQSQLGAMKLAASITAQHQIEQRVIQSNKKLECGNIINFFKAA